MPVIVKCDNQNCNRNIINEPAYVINVDGKVYDILGNPSNRLVVCKECLKKFEELFGLEEFKPTEQAPAPEEAAKE